MRPAPANERLTDADRNMPGKPSRRNNLSGAGSHQRIVSRKILIPATAQQWNPGVKGIEGTWNEGTCRNIMGCKCKVKYRTLINIGNSTMAMCAGDWVVDDAFGTRYIITNAEMEKVFSANEKLTQDARP